MIYILLANGFEEIEAITPLDILKRAEKNVQSVSVGSIEVEGAHGIRIKCDKTISEVDPEDCEMLVLPGGKTGVENLQKCETVKKMIYHCDNNKITIAAICAAPKILGELGLLKGKRAVCYPGFEKYLCGCELSERAVERDKNIITARGAGVSIEFSLELVREFCEEKAEMIYEQIQCGCK